MGGNAQQQPSGPGRPLSIRVIVVGGVAVGMVAAAAAAALLYFYGGGTDQDQAGLNAVRTAGTLVVGIGGALALLLTARRQRSTELTLEHQREVAAAAARDAVEQRITELYARAVDQLGNNQAPVRLGGLHALERLAQNNPSQRQTIVDVICSYLRMPYNPLDNPPSNKDITTEAHTRYEQQRQELQVRLTAQRILAAHLKSDAVDTFWPGINLDLTQAHLHRFDLSGCHIRKAQFGATQFFGDTTDFAETRFSEAVDFTEAEFCSDARFDGAQFSGKAIFERAQFHGSTGFAEVRFSKSADLTEARFHGDARFAQTWFLGKALFSHVEFSGNAQFEGTQFSDAMDFTGTEFHGDARFDGTQFFGKAIFGCAQFHRSAGFTGAKFSKNAGFAGARLFGNAAFGHAQFSGFAGFTRAKFFKNARFTGAEFSKNANFVGTRFSENPIFAGARARAENSEVLEHFWPATWTAQKRDEDNEGNWLYLVRVKEY